MHVLIMQFDDGSMLEGAQERFFPQQVFVIAAFNVGALDHKSAKFSAHDYADIKRAKGTRPFLDAVGFGVRNAEAHAKAAGAEQGERAVLGQQFGKEWWKVEAVELHVMTDYRSSVLVRLFLLPNILHNIPGTHVITARYGTLHTSTMAHSCP